MPGPGQGTVGDVSCRPPEPEQNGEAMTSLRIDHMFPGTGTTAGDEAP